MTAMQQCSATGAFKQNQTFACRCSRRPSHGALWQNNLADRKALSPIYPGFLTQT